jgi:hypothetical protein
MSVFDKVFCYIYAVNSPVLDFIFSLSKLSLHCLSAMLDCKVILVKLSVDLGQVEEGLCVISFKSGLVKAPKNKERRFACGQPYSLLLFEICANWSLIIRECRNKVWGGTLIINYREIQIFCPLKKRKTFLVISSVAMCYAKMVKKILMEICLFFLNLFRETIKAFKCFGKKFLSIMEFFAVKIVNA